MFLCALSESDKELLSPQHDILCVVKQDKRGVAGNSLSPSRASHLPLPSPLQSPNTPLLFACNCVSSPVLSFNSWNVLQDGDQSMQWFYRMVLLLHRFTDRASRLQLTLGCLARLATWLACSLRSCLLDCLIGRLIRQFTPSNITHGRL